MKLNSFKKSFPRTGRQIAVWNKRYNKWVIDEAVKSEFGGHDSLTNTSLFDATHWISLPEKPIDE